MAAARRTAAGWAATLIPHFGAPCSTVFAGIGRLSNWEGDLIKGAMNRSSVGTLVERTSRYVMLVKLNGGCADDILEGFTRRLKRRPTEPAKHHDL